jgi:hypothetical protein
MTGPMVYALFMMPVLLTLGSVWRKHPPLRQTVLAQELYPLPSSLAYFLLATVAMSSRQGPRSAEHVAAPEKLADALLATGNYGEAGTVRCRALGAMSRNQPGRSANICPRLAAQARR